MPIDCLNLLLILALVAGHVALVVAVSNRIHGWPLTCRALRCVHRAHDVLLVALPVLFVALAGVDGPRLLFGGAWQRLPLPVLAYLAVCALVAAAVPVVGLARRLRRLPALQLSNHSQTIDVASRLGYRPVGRGPYRAMTWIPGNEFLKLQVSDKEYRMPRLPHEWDGLSILHLSDLHFIGTVDRAYYEQLVDISNGLNPDLVVFTGDLLDRKELIEWLDGTLGRLRAPLGRYYVLGNHDWYLGNPDETRRRLDALGWLGVAGRYRVREHCGRKLVLCGSELPWMGTQPDMTGAPDDAFRVFLSHTPDNIRWARRHSIDLMLSGHNHGGQVRLPLVGSVYSPSAYGGRYASGVFWEPPTLLYVSRGVSGRYPVRWNCLPELTRLILRAAPAGNLADRRNSDGTGV